MRFLLFAALILTLAACGGGEKTTKAGIKYKFVTDKGGAAAKVGDVAMINLSVYLDDTLVQTPGNMPMPVESLDSIDAMDTESRSVMEALMNMSVGDSIMIYVPIDSMRRQDPRLANKKNIVYHMGLGEIKTKEAYEKYAQEQEAKSQSRQAEYTAYKKVVEASKSYFQGREKAVSDSTIQIAADFLAGKVQTKAGKDGLKIAILREGAGPVIAQKDVIFANYFGVTKNGKHFDDSFKCGEPFLFPVGGGQVIKGWDLGFEGLKEGTVAVLFVPAALGYGAQGAGENIPPNTDLVFYVEAIKKI